MEDTPRQLDITNLAERLEIEVGHINTLVEQKIETLRTLLTQRADFFEASSSKEISVIDFKVTEALQEIRGYKDILSQQLVLLDESVKVAHHRLDEVTLSESEEMSTVKELKKDIQLLAEKIDGVLISVGAIKKEVDVLKQDKRDEELLKKAKKEDPIRVFFRNYGREVLIILLTGTGIYLIKNLEAFKEQLLNLF